MSEPETREAPLSLEALRNQGAEHLDPARFFYLEVLARRADEAAGELQPILQAKLTAALADYRERMAQSQPACNTVPPRNDSPLIGLNDYIRSAAPPSHVKGGRVEMNSVRRFREVWSRIAAVDQVAQAIVRGPENAGPLNSHMLVLRSLALMRELSPDYLRRFMSHVDSLLWLDEQGQKQAPVEVKPRKRAPAKK